MSPRNRILPIFIPQLGCPHACVFCNQREITGSVLEQAYRQTERLSELPASAEKRELAFYGGSFTAIPEEQQNRFLRYAYKAMEKGVISSIRLSTRPDAVTPEILSRLQFYGVETIELGAQSMRDSVLRLSGRGHTADDVRRSSAMIQEAGFHLGLQMMTGLPGDDPSGAQETAAEIIRIKPDAVRIYPTVIVRNTELERLWRSGQYREHSVEDAVTVCAQILPMFESAGIPVIRLGLNPTEELSSGGALAGAYHPALGELIRSRVLRNQAENLLMREECRGKKIVLAVPPRQYSQMIGQKRCNITWLNSRFGLAGLKVISDAATGQPVIRQITEGNI